MKTSMRAFLIAIFLSCSFAISAQTMKALEFKNQEIRDILFVLGELNQVSILPDETVSGRASFIFSNMDFDEALHLFLDANGLYSVDKNNTYYISRARIEYVAANDRISIKGTEVPLRALVNAVANAAGKTILFDQLPSDTISVQAKDISLREFLGMAMARYPEYFVDATSTYFYIRKRTAPGSADLKPANGFFIAEGDRYSIVADRAKFRDIILDLFEKANKEVVFLMDQNAVLEDLNYQGKSFEDMLRIVLLRAGGDFSVSGGVYYILESQKRDLQNKLLTTLIVPLQHISFQDFQRLLPPSLGSGGKIRMDEKDNRVVLNGTMEELRPIIDFISLVDSGKVNESSIRIDLSFLKSDEALPLLPAEFSAFAPVGLPSKSGFIITLPSAKVQRLKDFIALVDRQNQGFPIELKFIKADELLANPPPSVTDQNLKKSPSPTLVFFRGSESQRGAFLRDLAAIDKPRPQIRYQLLILELEDTNNLTWQAGITASSTDLQSGPGFSLTKGSFSGLLGLNFDVISTFGLKFGIDLNWQMTSQKAKVVADTTLQALSGEKISFRNTRTIRVPVTTSQSASGSTSATTTTDLREVTSGLILSIEGTASGARMITLKLDSTLSKNMGASADKTSIATTTEKVLTTTVRTEVGVPVAVTGLKQEQVIETVNKIPILGDIPLLGWLFTTTTNNPVQTQYVIYIIPHMEEPVLNRDLLERDLIEQYYQYFFARDDKALR